MSLALLAQLAAPFAKWGALLVGAVLAVAATRGWIRRGAKDELRVELAAEAAKELQDADREYREDLAEADDRWGAARARGRVHHDPPG